MTLDRRALTRYVALIALEIIIGIHVALNPDHLEEKFYIGVLFAVGNGLLFLAMLLLVSERFRVVGWLLGAAICLGEFGGYVASRTVGLPQGYKEAWVGQPEDYLGMASLVCELVVLAAAFAALRVHAGRAGRHVTITDGRAGAGLTV